MKYCTSWVTKPGTCLSIFLFAILFLSFFFSTKLSASPTAQSECRKPGHSALGSVDNDHKNAGIWDKEENHKQAGQSSMSGQQLKSRLHIVTNNQMKVMIEMIECQSFGWACMRENANGVQ